MAQRPQQHFRRWMVLSLLAAFVLIAWRMLMPQGFPIEHPRFWANSVFPVFAGAICLIQAGMCFKRSPALVWLLPFVPGLFAGLLLTCLWHFPQSLFQPLSLCPLAALIYLSISGYFLARLHPRPQRAWFVGFLAFGIGSYWAVSQRAPSPSTTPLMEAAPSSAKLLTPLDRYRPLEFNSGRAQLTLYPFLSIDSYSPDGFWSLFAGGFEPEDQPQYFLQTNGNQLVCWTEFSAPNHSHLNSFTELSVQASSDIWLEFSPCPGERVAVLPSDYPTGRPARAAYIDEGGNFVIVEAHSGEKGPFKTLAEGSHDTSKALWMKIFEGERLAFTLTFDDYCTQASTELSPSAGWGFPQNSIQFSAIGENKQNSFIVFSLASTSVGRGFDTVSHAAGAYRNRLKIEEH